MPLKTPIAFFIFNRPQLTQTVFDAIRQAQPQMLLVIADGPCSDRAGEAELCDQTRAVVQQIDWNCQVLINFSEVNLGCKQRVSSGLDWVFNTVEEAIILEDDCLPHPTFFPFCEELLAYYRDDERIMMISGDNFQFGHKRTNESYYFSRFAHIWGWATWRRAWRRYDVEMKQWSDVREGQWLADILHNSSMIKYWTNIFQSASEGSIDTWDYAWIFACWIQHGLTVLPNSNLVANIGFHPTATHTRDPNSKFANLPVEALASPLKHPRFVIADNKADHFTQKTMFNSNRINFIEKIFQRMSTYSIKGRVRNRKKI